MKLHLFSFGYKYGDPINTDIIFDVRDLPNPYWEPSLRPYNGKDLKIITFLEQQPEVQQRLETIYQSCQRSLSEHTEPPTHLTIGIGCTGGKHRSVYIVEQLAKWLSANYPAPMTTHRELERW